MVVQSAEPESGTAVRRSRVPAAVRALRPRQWIKNVLVLTVPLAAGVLFRPAVLLDSALAFVAFCLISGCVYLINDIRDIEEDRLHPKKRLRPIPAGELRISAAWVLAGIVGVAGFAIGFATSVELGITLAVYLGLQIIYSTFLKHQPVIDLAMVSSGFLLRAVAGGVANDLALSQWFLLVASFGSLFMVAGKRYSEMLSLGAEAGTRRSLARYSESYLRFAWMLAAAMVLISYSLWAFENLSRGAFGIGWTAISIAPFTLGLLRYAMDVDAGNAGEPEDVVLRDRVLQIFGLIWLVLIAVAVFTGRQQTGA
ncbi:decaprenyl-phosphate phosphoribosyltransferase [Friedmanniella endophytica]|uniref:Decaprenyl-phosphate phosphoribosyltransferase n=1 Tax=Microlunatus kandeliicorticis TaxID=1759536 RepID=A0A7W3P4W4_9ACTN|nr:decaprenyl-phosphate phosphoribosyltransferase [Microlunatus kandeliicorticis]MBA8793334.1 decaprenyl-phosphate phosphoribosyltransferase [Microlunatus kandeliicorticis]